MIVCVKDNGITPSIKNTNDVPQYIQELQRVCCSPEKSKRPSFETICKKLNTSRKQSVAEHVSEYNNLQEVQEAYVTVQQYTKINL